MTFDPTITLGALITMLATFGLYLYQWLDKARVRRWAREDAELVAADLKKEAAAIADKVAAKLSEDAAKVSSESTERSKVLATTVTENITASTIALKASNALNEKIADLTSQLIAIKLSRGTTRKRSTKGTP